MKMNLADKNCQRHTYNHHPKPNKKKITPLINTRTYTLNKSFFAILNTVWYIEALIA